jgi:exopolysaccharide biosynthesis predicted pyruvyltransferase EpsI
LNSGNSAASLDRADSVTKVVSHPVGSEPLPGRKNSAQPQPQQPPPPPPPPPPAPVKDVPISYDKTTPPTVGCESIVRGLQRKIIEAYQVQLKGIRYVNVFGYLETENKGDAAIWVAQQILLATMGITFMEACRFIDKGCNFDEFKRQLKKHEPYSGIIMAGGGNFNDFYWEDQPARILMVETFQGYPIRAFPQSIHMTSHQKIEMTKESFNSHSDLQLAARDQPSFNWLKQEFGSKAQGVEPDKVKHILIPDIVFMYGNRPDFRIKTKKTYVSPSLYFVIHCFNNSSQTSNFDTRP